MPLINILTGGFSGHSSITAPSKDEPEYLGQTMLFAQATAPIGWTKVSTYNDCAVRIVNGVTSNGGSSGFTSSFSTVTPYSPAAGPWEATIGTTTVTVAQMGAHTHITNGTFSSVSGNSGYGPAPYRTVYRSQAQGPTVTGSTGAGGGHTHGGRIDTVNITSSLDMSVKYVDVILARY